MKSIIFHLIGNNALFMFYVLNICITAFVFPLVIRYHDFLILFAPSSWVASLVYSLCTWDTL
jgi:hypothetical protein